MKRVLTIIGAVVVALYVVALVVPFDPEERRPGTRLSGDLAADQAPAWATYEPRKKIYVQTQTWYLIPHSVTTVSWVDDGMLYVPCRTCAGKTWSTNVARNPLVRLKIDGELYERRAVPIEDALERRRLLSVAEGEPLPDVALYRMDPV